MAGPSASVLVKFDMREPTWHELLTPYASDWHDGSSCGIADTTLFGGQYQGEPRPFVGGIEPFRFDSDEYPDEAALSKVVCRHANIELTSSIVVAAMCNQPVDHQILCEVLIDLATKLSGIIDFDCLDVAPYVKLHHCESRFNNSIDWTMIGTPDEARSWLRHPAFHMVK